MKVFFFFHYLFVSSGAANSWDRIVYLFLEFAIESVDYSTNTLQIYTLLSFNICAAS